MNLSKVMVVKGISPQCMLKIDLQKRV